MTIKVVVKPRTYRLVISKGASGGGSGVTSVSGTAPITSTGGTTPAIGISTATESAAGSMSAADKTKLDGVATGADVTANNAPQAHAASHKGGGTDAIDVAGAADGLMSSTDKSKLDGIATGADVTADNAPQAHAASHENGGSDEINLAGLSGAGVTTLSVANIDDPSAELNAIAGSAAGDLRLCYQADAATNEWTLYAWDDADTDTEQVPFMVDGSSGMWVAVGGKYLAKTLLIRGANSINALEIVNVLGNTTVKFITDQWRGVTMYLQDQNGVGKAVLSARNNQVNYVNNGVGLAVSQTSLTANYHFQLPDDPVKKALANAWDVYSDIALKDNVNPLPKMVDKIKQLQPVSFVRKSDPGKTELGLIANDVKSIFPEAVSVAETETDEDGNIRQLPQPLHTMNYNMLIAPLLKAVQELTARLESAEAKIAALENIKPKAI